MKQFPEAIVAFQAALAIGADHLVALNGLGLAYKAVLKLDEAEKTLARVIELDPQNFSRLSQQERFYQGQKNFDKAIEKYREAIKLKPDSAEARLNNLGGALKEQGELEDDRVHCRESYRASPTWRQLTAIRRQLAQLQGDTVKQSSAIKRHLRYREA
ncbi:MAG: tetratricopeptide repeat protein [Pirellulaceae bacterium]